MLARAARGLEQASALGGSDVDSRPRFRFRRGIKWRENDSTTLAAIPSSSLTTPEKKDILQQPLEQTTVRRDVIVLQQTLTDTGRGACTMLMKGIPFLEHEVLGENNLIEHAFIEVITRKKTRKENTFMLNVCSHPAHRKQEFKALLHKANHITDPSNKLVMCRDFTTPNQAWG
ncbi:hypothetical protein HPB51_007639 [Rhipicephalus microplus]|uniref:Tick transposon n=1 Tax=Rhipicephalus microplus TaxID=6941 RepID=A0A9J6ERE3_RHIMP|nr:hypothetical protein HPB51_007639 [Rhipicephalus microplus]